MDASAYNMSFDKEQLSVLCANYDRRIDTLAKESAALRELVRDMWFWGYEGHMDSESQEWQMKHIGGVFERMRELKVKTDYE